MHQVCIHVPSIGPEQSVEVEVKIDGTRHIMDYRVLTCDWTQGGTNPHGRFDRLRSFIRERQEHWELVQIGTPTSEDLVPIMFRQHIRPAEQV